jgi:uncharacterized protein YbjT (DUF2867 family)
MKVMLFGATGMVGLGVLRECLLDRSVTEVIAINRSLISAAPDKPSQAHWSKLRQIVRTDLFNLDGLDDDFASVDACLFSLGVTSLGISEADYRHLTYDLTLSIAQRFIRVNPKIVFIYVSGQGTDSSVKGKTSWANVKGETENALLALPFRGAFMFRPGVIVPLNGIRSKTKVYQLFYTVLSPILPFLERRFPHYITTTAALGQAMIRLAKKGIAEEGPPRRILECADIDAS